jgi:hypothetical protein
MSLITREALLVAVTRVIHCLHLATRIFHALPDVPSGNFNYVNPKHIFDNNLHIYLIRYSK